MKSLHFLAIAGVVAVSSVCAMVARDSNITADATTKTAVTVFLAPPGSPIAMYEGATSKSELLETLQKAGSCGPGGVCGPGGCGPQ